MNGKTDREQQLHRIIIINMLNQMAIINRNAGIGNDGRLGRCIVDTYLWSVGPAQRNLHG